MTKRCLQMREVPSSVKGLGWIVEYEPDRLLLIPGLDAETIISAAEGDQQALAQLRTIAHSAASNAHDMSDVKFWDLAASCQRDPAISALHPQITAAGCLAVTSSKLAEFTSDSLRCAVKEGELEALQWLRAICQPVNPRAAHLTETAAAAGQLHILQYLCSGPNQPPRTAQVLRYALEHPKCLPFLLTLRPRLRCRYQDAEDLANRGHLDTLQLLHAHKGLREPLQETLALLYAVWGKHQAVLEWLRSLNPPCPWNAEVMAASMAPYSRSHAMMQWMRQQQPPCPWDETSTARAAVCGDLEALQWMRRQVPPCPWDARCCKEFASQGNLPALLWLRGQEPPCPWDQSCTRVAAGMGNLEVLQWLRQQEPPCPWNADTSEGAAYRGDIRMLKWIQSQGGPLPGELYVTAVRNHRMSVVRWLHQERIPMTSQGETCKSMSVPFLMFLGNIGYGLPPFMHNTLVQARRTFCTFHGLVRWCSRPSSDPRQHSVHRHGRVSLYSRRALGEELLEGLARLPPELVTKIAVAAGLQHAVL